MIVCWVARCLVLRRQKGQECGVCAKVRSGLEQCVKGFELAESGPIQITSIQWQIRVKDRAEIRVREMELGLGLSVGLVSYLVGCLEESLGGRC